MDGWWTGVNWWANNRWKASIGYGNIDLDRFGVTGNTKILLTCLHGFDDALSSRRSRLRAWRLIQRRVAWPDPIR